MKSWKCRLIQSSSSSLNKKKNSTIDEFVYNWGEKREKERKKHCGFGARSNALKGENECYKRDEKDSMPFKHSGSKKNSDRI